LRVRNATNIADLAQSTAHQLRLLQADLATEPPEVRAQSLAEVVRDAMGQVVPEQRAEFLRTLEEKFPTFPGEQPAGGGAAVELNDPLTLAEMLAAQGAGLSAPQKQAIVDQLAAAGFPVGKGGPAAGDGALPAQALEELRRPLQLIAAAKIDPTRAAELLPILVDLAVKLDQAVWASWAQVAPQSPIRRPGVLQRTMARFLAGEPMRGQMSADAETLLKLTASLIVSLQKIGPTLFRQYFDPISPNTIKEEVEWSLRSKEAQCWKKYEERAGTMEAASFSAALLSVVGKFVQEFFHPAGVPSKP
jgi:hypothetical protein